MATKQEQEAFIKKVAPHIVTYAKQYGVLTPSAVIAQACHETGYGVGKGAEVKVSHNNFFGLKYKPNRVDCNSGYFNDKSTEEYQKNVYTPIECDWYAFKNAQDGCLGYFEFCYKHTDHYKSCLGIDDSYAYLKQIKSLGYATGSDYAEHCYQVVVEHDLTKYDPKPKSDINITPAYGHNNMTNLNNRPIKYIVVHYTAGTTSKAGSSKNVASYFDKATTRASADFIVDDTLITQFNGNIENYYTWHCGGNKYNTKGGSLYNIASNKNTIGIEMCSNNATGRVTQANDNNWYFTDATVNNTIKLVTYLMKKYNIPKENVIRHYDVTGKPCPAVFGWNEDTGNIDRWIDFKKRL